MKKKIDYKKQGKRNRERGQEFESRVRKDLESKEWVIDRWTNNVEFMNEMDFVRKIKSDGTKVIEHEWYNGRLIPAKSNRFNMRTTGFPDFIAFRNRILSNYEKELPKILFEIIGVEVKSGGYLSKIEKAKCKWLLDNKKFSKILIASKGKKRGEIKYVEFK